MSRGATDTLRTGVTILLIVIVAGRAALRVAIVRVAVLFTIAHVAVSPVAATQLLLRISY